MQSVQWGYCNTGGNSGKYNMWFDEMLVRRLIEGKGGPVVRMYYWSPWAISIGHHQNLSDINLPQCHDNGIEVVRRPTGGRAILHAEELTYCVVMPAHQKGVLAVYNEISQALVDGLKLFGVDVTLQRSQPDFGELYKNPSSIPCFSSSARYEIEWEGKKLVGSAQRRYATPAGDIVLQHGSLLCGKAHRRLGEYLAVTDPDIRGAVQKTLETRTADLEEITGAPVDREHLAVCLKRGFASALQVEFEEFLLQEKLPKESYA
jgi:lipoate-protein ligase A